MSDARGDEKELDVLEPGEGEGVDGLDRVVIDHHHRDVLWSSEGVSRQGVDSWGGKITKRKIIIIVKAQQKIDM